MPSARRGTCERACEFSAVPAAMASRVVPLNLSPSRQRRRGGSSGQIAVCTWRRCSVAAARRDAIPLAQGFRRVRPGTSMASFVIDAALHLVYAAPKTRSPTACSQRLVESAPRARPSKLLRCASETSSESNGTVLAAVSRLASKADTFSQLTPWLWITQAVRHRSHLKVAHFTASTAINKIQKQRPRYKAYRLLTTSQAL